jgi:hypothetical protein
MAAVALSGAALAGCAPTSSSPEPDDDHEETEETSSPTPTADPIPEVTPTEAAPQFAPVNPAEYLSNYGNGVEFDSPSLNIHCGIFPAPDYEFYACSIDQYTYVDPPPAPDQVACAENISYGHGFFAPLDGEVKVLCRGGAGEWEIDPHPVLEYGTSIKFGGVICESTSDHMGCRSLGGGHGFTLSRNSYTTF